MKLEANTYIGLTWGLINFDGIETDLRLTKDKKLVIFHDAHLATGELVADLTQEELIERGTPTLETFFSLPEVVELSSKKVMYIELKPNCNGTKRITKPMASEFYTAFQEVVKASDIDTSGIAIISFATDLLDPFVGDYPCFPLLPDVNECSDSWVMLKALPQVLGKSLTSEMKKASKMGYAGLFFARQYVIGLISMRHPNYAKATRQADEMGLLLGTNLGTPELEKDYAKFARFSDKLADYPRHADEGDGPIIAHRGTGTKGVEVPEEDIPDLAI